VGREASYDGDDPPTLASTAADGRAEHTDACSPSGEEGQAGERSRGSAPEDDGWTEAVLTSPERGSSTNVPPTLPKPPPAAPPHVQAVAPVTPAEDEEDDEPMLPVRPAIASATRPTDLDDMHSPLKFKHFDM
jgi:hypothetical protein